MNNSSPTSGSLDIDECSRKPDGGGSSWLASLAAKRSPFKPRTVLQIPQPPTITNNNPSKPVPKKPSYCRPAKPSNPSINSKPLPDKKATKNTRSKFTDEDVERAGEEEKLLESRMRYHKSGMVTEENAGNEKRDEDQCFSLFSTSTPLDIDAKTTFQKESSLRSITSASPTIFELDESGNEDSKIHIFHLEDTMSRIKGYFDGQGLDMEKGFIWRNCYSEEDVENEGESVLDELWNELASCYELVQSNDIKLSQKLAMKEKKMMTSRPKTISRPVRPADV